jgi:hypothetical protein
MILYFTHADSVLRSIRRYIMYTPRQQNIQEVCNLLLRLDTFPNQQVVDQSEIALVSIL